MTLEVYAVVVEISIHAPARGQTSPCFRCPWSKSDFNSRPREGANVLKEYGNHVQILFQFTPPRGGKLNSHMVEMPYGIFQFTPPRGGKPGRSGGETVCFISIHAPARGQTLTHRMKALYLLYFNSRPREGANRGADQYRGMSLISIHAPARGQTGARSPKNRRGS